MSEVGVHQSIGHAWVPSSAVTTFSDPLDFQRTIRGTSLRAFLNTLGEYHAELTRIDLHHLWMQDSRQSLGQLILSAAHLAHVTPDILAHREVAKAIEQQLIQTMVACLITNATLQPAPLLSGSGSVMRRFENAVSERQFEPIYLPEICAEIGVSDRTLRLHCQEHLGMSPRRYLWLRRMHLARRTLALADPAIGSVTAIAMDHGFGELGRFAVEYRKLFGEPPRATLYLALTG